ncbi:hypothetical protein [Maribacter sp. Asnod2-G09]|uniref:hypothetical protein n=1 Tax=Maribacter sp. Asnod2-G09 TaxID=3160577 RepID=UPI00386E4E6C
MKKAQIYIVLLLITTLSCKDKVSEKLKNIALVEPKTELITEINTLDNLEEQKKKEGDNKLDLTFSPIDSTQYFDYKKKYSNDVTIDSLIINKENSFFTLSIKNTEKKFSCGIDFNNCTYYKGYLNSLNKYVLTYCGVLYCGTSLLDKNTGIQNYLESPFDTECETPSLSKDKNKLISYSSSVFDKESFIGLYKKNTETQEIDFENYETFNTSDWRINEIIWVDDNFIALKIYDKYGGITGDKLMNVRYLKSKIE